MMLQILPAPASSTLPEGTRYIYRDNEYFGMVTPVPVIAENGMGNYRIIAITYDTPDNVDGGITVIVHENDLFETAQKLASLEWVPF